MGGKADSPPSCGEDKRAVHAPVTQRKGFCPHRHCEDSSVKESQQVVAVDERCIEIIWNASMNRTIGDQDTLAKSSLCKLSSFIRLFILCCSDSAWTTARVDKNTCAFRWPVLLSSYVF